jgi:hypothetical protein
LLIQKVFSVELSDGSDEGRVLLWEEGVGVAWVMLDAVLDEEVV